MAKFSSIATERAQMTSGAREALDALDASLIQMFQVKSNTLPENMRGKKKYTTFEFLANRLKETESPEVDPRSVSAKIRNGQLEGTAERMATINKYRDMAATDEGIDYTDTDDRGQYEAEVNFCCMLAKMGVLGEDDLQEKD